MKYPIALVTTASLALLAVSPAKENDRLTREERGRVGHLYAKVLRDKEVQAARQAHESALNHYHEALRNAMTKRDPEIEPALQKIKRNPSRLAEAIWEKRNKDVLDNLHLPIRRLEKAERKQWNQAMSKLRSKELSKAFGKRLEQNYQQQVKLRKAHASLVGNYKKEALRKLMEIDSGLKPIVEKLVKPQDHARVDQTAEATIAVPLDPEVTPDVEELETDPERIPPMPIPMPAPPEEC